MDINIVNFISGNDLGGPKQSFILYSKIFEKNGYKTTSVVRKGSKLSSLLREKELNTEEVSYFRTLKPIFKNYSIVKLRHILQKLKPSIIFVHKQIDIELIKQASDGSTKIIGVIHGFNSKHIESADVLIAVSKTIKEFLEKSGFKKPIYIVPNMIENESDPTLRKIPQVPTIGTMGIFRRKKGHHIFIQALSILKAKDVSFKAIIAGKGIRRPVLIYLRYKYSLQNELKIIGWISNNEREAFLDSIDIFVLPSRTESFGMVVPEAMGRKKIVISTRCGGPEEIIDNGIDGYLVKNQDPEAIANKIEKVILNRDHADTVQIKAFEKAIGKYSTGAVEDKLKAIINSLWNT